jgi:type I restriction enzyme R subunit
MKILPPASRFSKDNGHAARKQRVLDKLGIFFDRFFGLT